MNLMALQNNMIMQQQMNTNIVHDEMSVVVNDTGDQV
jgi:hypothetical protein